MRAHLIATASDDAQFGENAFLTGRSPAEVCGAEPGSVLAPLDLEASEVLEHG